MPLNNTALIAVVAEFIKCISLGTIFENLAEGGTETSSVLRLVIW